jgi:uncharacterized membrane protein
MSQSNKFQNLIGSIITLFSLSGIIVSFILTIERINILKDANHLLSCSVNATFNCASVMTSWQAEILGFPNSIIGIAGYTLTFALGIGILFYKDFNKKLINIGLIGNLGAFIFSYWLLHQSAFAIQSLCIYCLISCFSATNIFFATILYSLQQNSLNFKEETMVKINTFLNKGLYFPIIAVWYLVIIVIIYLQFADRF